MIQNRAVILLLLALIGNTCFSSHYTFSNLISDIPVFAITSDQNNIIWIGTENGLVRYDSKNFKQYTFNSTDPHSLSDNSVRSLLADSYGRLWVGTRNGLNLYNPIQDNFLQFLPDNTSADKLHGRFVKSIVEGPDGMIWITSESEGLTLLNPATMAMYHIKETDAGNTIVTNLLEKAVTDEQGTVWLATRDGLNFKKANNPWQHLSLTSKRSSHATANDIITIAPDKNGGLWISTRDTMLHYLNSNGQLRSAISSEDVSSLYSDDTDNLYIGTTTGTVRLIAKGSPDPVQTGEVIVKNRNLGAIRDIYVDRWQNIWIGSENGLFVHFASQRQFSAVKVDTSENLVSDIATLLKDQDQRIWVSSRSRLLIKEQNHWRPAQSIYPSLAKISGFIYKLYKGSENNLWIGTFAHGLYQLNTQTGQLNKFLLSKFLPDAPNDINNIWDMKEDKQGNLWIGTWGGGLVYYDVENNQFTSFLHKNTNPNSLSNNKILSLLIDSNDQLWIGTDGGGLNTFDPENKIFTRHNLYYDHKTQILDRSILCLHEDGDGIIWIGSDGGGLLRYNPLTDQLRVYNHSFGLSNQSVKMILEDDENNLWISTNGGGIFRFDPYQESFVQFTQLDGLSSNRFQNGAGFKDSEGLLYFGGPDGYSVIDPSSVKINDYSPQIVLTDVFINNQNKDKDGNLFLSRFQQQNEIRLSPSEQLLSIHFSAVEYTHSQTNAYRYRLKGLNDQWIDLDQQSQISLINLPHGKYTLELESTNSAGLWTGNTYFIRVRVLPPFYKTPVFAVMAIVVLLLSLYALHLYNVKDIKKRRKILEQEVANRTERINEQREKLQKQNKILQAQKEELTLRNQKIIDSTERIRLMTKKLHESDVMKIKFFTNISHEIRTPLTLIIGPLDQLIKKHSEVPESKRSQDIDYLITMRHNATKILRLFDQIITFRKLESGSLKLSKKRANLPEFLKDILKSFKDYVAIRNITLEFKDHTGGIEIDFDQEKIEKVFTNLLSNAVKFNKDNGKISVELHSKWVESVATVKDGETHKHSVEIVVKDTGIGISPNAIDKIFDMFYQAEDPVIQPAEHGVGIGLSLAKSLVEMHNGTITVASQPGEGSVFSISLPTDLTYGQHQKTQAASGKTKQMAEVLTGASKENLQATGRHFYPLPPQLPQTSAEAKSAHEKTILLVEDNNDLRNYMACWLGEEFNVLVAENGVEGISIAEKKQPDLIISDIVMPLMGGLELLDKIKTNIETSHIPVILLTAKATVEDKIEGFKLYADAYIAKPFHLQHLLFTINSLMENRLIVQRKYRELFSFEPTETHALSPDEQFLKRTKDIIEENISNPDFTINQLSKEVGVSRAGIYRKINALLNTSVNTLIRNMRIRKAAQMLAKNSFYINEIAFEVGFNDVQYFRKCFRKMYNMTPSEYAAKFVELPAEKESIK